LSFFIYDSDREKETGVVRGLNEGTTADRDVKTTEEVFQPRWIPDKCTQKSAALWPGQNGKSGRNNQQKVA
jgi:hypothetical protein